MKTCKLAMPPSITCNTLTQTKFSMHVLSQHGDMLTAQVVLISQCRIVDIICEWERKELPIKNKIDHQVAELTCGAFTKPPTTNFRSCAYPCPGAASLLLYAETAGAVVVAGNLVYYLICLTPRSVPRLPISPQQQKLLGLSNADLGETTSFYSGLF